MKKIILALTVLTSIHCFASTLNIYFPRFDINVDPQTMIDARSMQVNLQIHRGLFRYLPNGQVKSDLVSKWEFSPDKKIFKVKLKNAIFSDGTPIKAKHVVNSFVRMFVIESSMSADLNGILGSQKMKTAKDLKTFGVQAIGDLDVEFRLEKANAIFLQQLATADCAILPINDVNTEIFGTKPWVPKEGAGPYKIIKKSEDELILKKWRKDEFETTNPPDQIHIFLTKETSAQILVDTIKTDSLDQAVVSKSEKMKLVTNGWTEFVTDLTREHFLILNPEKISDELRKQLTISLDQKAVSKAMGPEFSPAFGLIPNVLGGALSKSPFTNKGNRPNTDGKSIEVLLPDTWEHGELLKKVLTKEWEPLHLNLKFKTVEVKEWNKAKVDKSYDILINSRGIDYPDGISILNYFRSGVSGNYYFVSDKSIDRMLNLSSQEFDQEKRLQYYQKIQEAILAKHVVVPMFFGSQTSGLWGPRVKSVPAHPLGYHFLPFEMIEMR